MSEGSGAVENSFVRDVASLIKSKAAVITTESGEWKRIQAGILDAIDAEIEGKSDVTKRYFLKWNEVTKLMLWNEEVDDWDNSHPLINKFATKPWHDIMERLKSDIDVPFILWFDDTHKKFNLTNSEENIRLIEHVRQFARVNHIYQNRQEYAGRKTLLFSGESVAYLEEFQHESTKVDLPLPTYPVLKRAFEMVIDEYNIPSSAVDYDPHFVESALGLSVDQALRAYRMAYNKHGNLNSDVSRKEIIRCRKEIIEQSGCLEYLEPSIDINDVGGLELLKEWLAIRKKAYGDDAKKRGIPTPKGILLTGVPGCGKSLTAKAIASTWGFPLVRFDIGAAFGSRVGQSEGNIRQALKIAEAASPCVLWIDEIEKGLAGAGGSGDNDSGTTMRVFGTILTWLNEVEKPVFVVATANHLDKLPPELKRKGRWDEIFFIDLPDHESRKEILKIKLTEREKAALELVDLERLATITDKFTGAEIEAVIKSAQMFSFNEGREVLDQQDLEEEITRLIPMAEAGQMGKQIEAMRKEADEIGQRASVGNRGGIQPRRQKSGGLDLRGA